MFKHILIPTDGSDLSRKAVLYGVELAKAVGAKVTALTLTEPYHVASMDAVLVSIGEDEYDAESRRISD
jgi:nucleotide-binding universal stress UspA family protein